ncbi:MAG: hypothetical protein DMF97_06250 [Acidobacteria bacterium]|nr:MAG: hypothetical protein DMF97_06250 [Acidobacteriota bacterium]PYR26618.1 MAG: hypothetical protein DMF98_08430 [Acidobacteriota bacterium]
MNCFTHGRNPAVGMCAICQKGICHECVARETPRLLCRACEARPSGPGYAWYGWYGYGFEYRSSTTIGTWPLVHVCAGIDPVTMRPRIAKGILAVGNIAVGVLAIGGLACGLFTVGGASIGLLLAVGGAALGLGVSVGGFAVGSIAIGGAAVGFMYAIGGGAFGPAVIDGRHCDDAARDFVRRWLDARPLSCR